MSKIILDVELLKQRCQQLNKALAEFHSSLLTITENREVRIKGKHSAVDVYVAGISIKEALYSYITETYEVDPYSRINSIYDNFAGYFLATHNVDITDKTNTQHYLTPSKIGRLFSKMDTTTLPFIIKKGKNAFYRYYDIIPK